MKVVQLYVFTQHKTKYAVNNSGSSVEGRNDSLGGFLISVLLRGGLICT